MSTIQVDDRTAEALAVLAQSKGLSVQQYLAALVKERPSVPISDKAADFEMELGPLLFHGPSLPTSFSRADIYSDRG